MIFFLFFLFSSVVEITTVQTQRVVRDIVFLVDGSNYIGSNNFPYVRDFMINVVNQLEVNPERVQIGLMQFAEQPKIEFYLNTARDRQDVVDRISQLRLMGGSFLNTGAAMEYALRNMFNVAAGSRQRQGVQQVLVLITGGPAQDEIKIVADKLALGGVLTFAVSSGQADQTVLQSVAFVPDLAYHEPSFANLPAVAEQIMPKLITVVGDTNLETPTEPGEFSVSDTLCKHNENIFFKNYNHNMNIKYLCILDTVCNNIGINVLWNLRLKMHLPHAVIT